MVPHFVTRPAHVNKHARAQGQVQAPAAVPNLQLAELYE